MRTTDSRGYRRVGHAEIIDLGAFYEAGSSRIAIQKRRRGISDKKRTEIVRFLPQSDLYQMDGVTL